MKFQIIFVVLSLCITQVYLQHYWHDHKFNILRKVEDYYWVLFKEYKNIGENITLGPIRKYMDKPYESEKVVRCITKFEKQYLSTIDKFLSDFDQLGFNMNKYYTRAFLPQVNAFRYHQRKIDTALKSYYNFFMGYHNQSKYLTARTLMSDTSRAVRNNFLRAYIELLMIFKIKEDGLTFEKSLLNLVLTTAETTTKISNNILVCFRKPDKN